jgi:GntR family transcriptional repressor for pyruvate dehydrogenase complex
MDARTERRVVTQLRQPRLAEMVAATLRERIVNGELPDGATLPTLERLVDDFGVSPPSVREALRVLENEGLITVRRGNVGGAVVHRPKAENAAYVLGLVLQSRELTVQDLGIAVSELLTTCAVMCARRANRARTVVPALRKAHQRAVAAVDESGTVFERYCREFHQTLAEKCGNDSLELVYSSLAWLWSAQEEVWTTRVGRDESPSMELRQQGLEDHAAIVDAIASGDVERVLTVTRQHLERPDVLGPARNAKRRVQATSLMPGTTP